MSLHGRRCSPRARASKSAVVIPTAISDRIFSNVLATTSPASPHEREFVDRLDLHRFALAEHQPLATTASSRSLTRSTVPMPSTFVSSPR